ncbi:MAG: hypothetical protein IH623_19205 [Verrucomicrobia bacterium]|nr:hypothetical protein [Verrucomicrobiota bacterium]
MDLPKLYDGERIRLALRQLDQAFPGLLQSVVLIGGGAAWFYRESLRQWADADFPVPTTGPAEDEIWLSKDMDFMGLTVAEAADLSFFVNDARFNVRLARAIAALRAPEHRALKHWAKHHLPGYKE